MPSVTPAQDPDSSAILRGSMTTRQQCHDCNERDHNDGRVPFERAVSPPKLIDAGSHDPAVVVRFGETVAKFDPGGLRGMISTARVDP